MIPILHTNLEFGPSFSHSSFPKVFIIILKLCPYLATRYILYRKIDVLSVHLFSLPVATHGFMCGLKRVEDHGTNLPFKTWFVGNLLLSTGRNSFPKKPNTPQDSARSL